jgi:hypothetical protein
MVGYKIFGWGHQLQWIEDPLQWLGYGKALEQFEHNLYGTDLIRYNGYNNRYNGYVIIPQFYLV